MKKKWIIVTAAMLTALSMTAVGIYDGLLRDKVVRAENTFPFRAGEKYLAQLNYEKATAELEQAIVIEPNHTEAYLALAKAYRYMGDIDTAKITLENGYSRTNSTVIKRELMELETEEIKMTESIVGGSGDEKSVELMGRIYPADITELVLRECGLTDSDMEALAQFTKLERLDISGNKITDIRAVGTITTLKKFYAANNSIVDVSPLAGLQLLEYVGLRGNQIADASPLFGMESLSYLHLADNRISQISTPQKTLKLLYLQNNRLDNLEVIQAADLWYCDVAGELDR